MTWISDIKDQYDVPAIARYVGLQEMKPRTWGPCPACGAEKRESEGRRGPIGLTPDGRGWNCHRCSMKGDCVDLITFATKRKKGRDLAKADWDDIRSWAVSEGLAANEDVPAIRSLRQLVPQKSVAQTSPTKEDVASDSDDPALGSFRWREGRAEEAAARIWTEEGKVVLDYLRASGEQGGRKFKDETIREWMLGMEVVDGEPWLTIPMRDEHQRISNMKFRSITREKKTMRACPKRDLTLFGFDRITVDKKDTIICVEGELDVVALWQYGFRGNVVSTTAGAGTFKKEWADLIEPYGWFVLAYDDDAMGEQGAKKVAGMLGESRCSRAIFPMKDAGDCLAHDVAVESMQRAVKLAKPLNGSSLKQANDYAEELERLVNNPEELVGRPTGSKKLDHCIGGMRPGVMVITGGTGHGKSSAATWLCWEQAKQGYPTMITSFENRPISTVGKLVRMQLGKDFIKQTPGTRQRILNELTEMPIYIMDHYGNIDSKKMVEAIHYAVRRHGVLTVLVDHLGFLIQPGAEERAQIESIVRELAICAYNLKVTIMLICHPRTLSEDKERPTMNDLKGASAIKQDASEVIVIHKDKSDKLPYPATWFHVDKVRSEYGRSESKALLAFGPDSLIYADDVKMLPEYAEDMDL